MGLLDQLTHDPQMALGMGLLNAGGNSRMPVSLGQGLAQGWGNMQQTAQMAQRAKMLEQEQMMREMKMQQMQKQIADQEAMQRDARDSFQSPAQQALMGGGGPTNANAALIPGLAPRFDQQGFLAKLAQRNPLQAMEMQEKLKKQGPKYSTDVRVVTINGKPTPVQMADDGTWKPMGDNVAPAEKLNFQDVGGRVVGLDAYTGTEKAGVTKSMTPESRASNALGWANYNKPSIQNVEGVGMFSVGPNGTASPVTMGGKPILQQKPMNEFQGRAATFADMMTGAEKIMSDESLSGNQKPEVFAESLKALPSMGLGGKVGNYIETENRQKVRQAQETWVRAALRKESGAVIGPEEMAQEIRTFFPQLGDSDAVIKQKAELRETKRRGIEREAGPSYNPTNVIDFSQLKR